MPPKSRPFTADETNQIHRWIDEHWTGSKVCPISGHTTWDIPSQLVYLSPHLPPEMLFSQQVSVYPVVMVICKGCGYTVFFAAQSLGFEFPATDEEKKNG